MLIGQLVRPTTPQAGHSWKLKMRFGVEFGLCDWLNPCLAVFDCFKVIEQNIHFRKKNQFNEFAGEVTPLFSITKNLFYFDKYFFKLECI